MAKKQNFTYAVGKRKSVSARIRLFKGKGASTVNGKEIDKYFPGKVNQTIYSKPFSLTETTDKFYVSAVISGGGKKGQLDAYVHGVSKALTKVNKDKFKKVLKDAGLLTRDARIRQRRMVGTGGKARRKKQSPKR